jgi:hypothetical protein
VISALRKTIQALIDAVVTLTTEVSNLTAVLKKALAPNGPVKAILTVKGSFMPVTITIDTTNETATLSYVDRVGDPDDAPAGLIPNFASDNAALTVGAPTTAADPTTGKQVVTVALTPASVGVANVSVAPTDANGAAILEPDGVTPIPAPSPVQVTVDPGAPAGARLTTSPA